jgi:hypothetical protein
VSIARKRQLNNAYGMVVGIMRVCQKDSELNSFPWQLCEAHDSHTDKYWFMITNLFLNKCLHFGVENSCE